MKRKVEVFEYAREILRAVRIGTLVSTKDNDKYNTMTIQYGFLGMEWQKPIFILFLREHRYTNEILQRTGEFTINVPLGDYDKKIVGYCGTHSGRDVDKFKEMNLHAVPGELVEAPAIKEFPLTLECKVIYQQLQDRTQIPQDVLDREYPQDVEYCALACKEFHTAYYAEVVNSYILED